MATDTSFGFVRHFDDFNRGVIGTLDWTVAAAGAATSFAINTQVNGVIRGTVTNNAGSDTAVVYDALVYRADKGGPLVFEARVALTALTIAVFAGLAGRTTTEVPLEYRAAAFTGNDPDAVGFYFGAGSASWRYGGRANSVNTAQTVAPARFLPVINTFQTLRVVLNNDGKGTFRINGEILAENVAGCATVTKTLMSKFAIRDDGVAGSFDVDYRFISAGRS